MPAERGVGEITIKMRGNVRTGHKEVVVEYDSDPDLTRAEHERRHREIVELLVKDGTVSREAAAEIVFEERSQQHAQDEPTAEGQVG